MLLVVALGLAWGANFAVTVATPGSQELYPMTAWPMFSHSLPEEFTVYALLVEPEAGAPLLELPAAQAFDPDHDLDANDVNTVVGAIAGAYRRGCPDNVLRGACPGAVRDDWALPGGLADQWARNSQARLALEAPPHAITLAADVVAADGSQTSRHALFTYWPAEGPTVQPAPVPEEPQDPPRPAAASPGAQP